MMFSGQILWTARALCAAAVGGLLLAAAQAGSSSWDGPTVWTPDGGGNPPGATTSNGPEWTAPANWTGGIVPNGAGDIATFSNLTGRLNLQLATDITLGGLDVTSQRIDSRDVPIRTFTWDNNGSEVIINHPSNEFLLEHNHALTDSVKITKSGGQTRFSRLVSGPGGFILSGNQEFVLGETGTPNTFEGGVTFLDTSVVDFRTPVSTGTGAFTFTNTSTISSKITPRNPLSGALPNDVVVAAVQPASRE